MTKLNAAQQTILQTYSNSYDTPVQLGAIVMISANSYNSLLVELQRKVLDGYRVHEQHPQCATIAYMFKPAAQQEAELAALLAEAAA
jgi:urease beta subunit